MQKIQILFPDPMMRRLRGVARREDRPVSEVVRRAVERLLDQTPESEGEPGEQPRFPTFRGGKVLVAAADMKALIYEDDDA